MALTSPPYKFALALQGLAADLPSGADYPEDTLFWATDTITLYVGDGTSFTAVSGGGGGGGVTTVTDGITTVTSATEIDFTAGATVTDGGGGNAQVTITAAATISVTDGVTTVTPVSEIDFTSGATVTDGGSGVAQVAVSGAGGTPKMQQFQAGSLTAGPGAGVNFDWSTATASGDTLLDLTDPENPAFITDGNYTVLVAATLLSGYAAGDFSQLSVSVQANGLTVNSGDCFDVTAAAVSAAAGLIRTVTSPSVSVASDTVNVEINNFSALSTQVYSFSAWVVQAA